MVDDTEHEKRVRRFASIVLIVLVVALVSTLLVSGTEYLPVTAWLLVPGGIGIYQAIQVLRHPEQMSRTQPGPRFDEIIAHGGMNLEADGRCPAPGEGRLAVQDALDSIRQQRSFSRFGIPVAIIVGLGTLGWMAGAIASVVLGHDYAAAALCLVAAAGFGTLTGFSARLGKNLHRAEQILEEQLISLDAIRIEPLETNGLPPEREESIRWT